MNAKRKGAKNEHCAIGVLESAGNACTRAAALLGIDIIGIGPSDVVLVQCKTCDRRQVQSKWSHLLARNT